MAPVGSNSNRRHLLNVADAPELLFGARADFRQRCLSLHAKAVHERAVTHMRAEIASVREQAPNLAEFQSMFPGLEPTLVQEICAEALTPQGAVKSLLAIAQADPLDCVPCNTSWAGRDPAQDHVEFPLLVGADGWEVAHARSLVNASSEGPGQDWCDRVKAAADLPIPKAMPSMSLPLQRPLVLHNRGVDNADSTELETEYESRQRQGKQRAENRIKFPRKPRTAHRIEETTTDVTTASDGDVPGAAPPWRTLRLENRL